MSDLNSCHFIGRLTKDPVLITTKTGKKMCQFVLAVKGFGDQAYFFKMIAWEKLAETIGMYCKKGKKICVQGRLQQSKYMDKEGNPRESIQCNLTSMQFLEFDKNKRDEGFTPEAKEDDYEPGTEKTEEKTEQSEEPKFEQPELTNEEGSAF